MRLEGPVSLGQWVVHPAGADCETRMASEAFPFPSQFLHGSQGGKQTPEVAAPIVIILRALQSREASSVVVPNRPKASG